MDFRGFGKIARWSRDIIITEKLDGTNALVAIGEDGEFKVGSRNRWITPEADNQGFARWAYERRDELMKLGPGFHYGEFWGQGIGRKYGLTEKRFSLFNTSRWGEGGTDIRPECCGVVPVLYQGPLFESEINDALDTLMMAGSRAAPGFHDPEGIVIFHVASGTLFKKTIHGDEAPKTQLNACEAKEAA